MAASFFSMKKVAELQVLQATEFSFNTLPRYTLTSSLQKRVSDSNVDSNCSLFQIRRDFVLY